MFRNRPPTVPGSPVSSLASVPPISTIHKDSEGSGKACILSGDKQSCQTKHSSLNQWRYSIYMHVEFFFVFCWSCELNENEYLKITWSIYMQLKKLFIEEGWRFLWTYRGIQRDDPDSVIRQAYCQKATSLFTHGDSTQGHAHHLGGHLLPLCVLIQLSCLQNNKSHINPRQKDLQNIRNITISSQLSCNISQSSHLEKG